jgi:hypothetical protein
VGHLITIIKPSLETSIENVSEKVITLRRGESEVLGSETPISGLYNTRETALHVVAGKHNIQLYLLMNILLLLLTLLFLIYDV